MANGVLLVPGRGGRYTSEAFTSAGSVGADVIDVSHCTGVSVQNATSGGVGGTYSIEETIDGANWVTISATIAITDKLITRFEAANRPLSVWRINPANVTGLDATHTLTLTMMGGAIGSGLF